MANQGHGWFHRRVQQVWLAVTHVASHYANVRYLILLLPFVSCPFMLNHLNVKQAGTRANTSNYK
jgi:hypothetical protein